MLEKNDSTHYLSFVLKKNYVSYIIASLLSVNKIMLHTLGLVFGKLLQLRLLY